MKKVLFIILLFVISVTLKSEELGIKFYLQDGNFKEYRIDDIAEMNFIKSDVPYMMEVFAYGSVLTFDIKDITSLWFLSSNSLAVQRSDDVSLVGIYEIDSINFVPKAYNEIPLGLYSWMGKNLDVEYYRNGDPIPQVTDSAEWVNLQTGAWCYYNNDPAMGAIYGKLYNWYAVSDTRGLAPVGWHIPIIEEWKTIPDNLGGDSLAGGMLKSTGTIETGDGLWQSPNEGATNETNFSAVPGGYRYDTFTNMGITTNYWSSTEQEMSKSILTRALSYDKSALGTSWGKKSCGFSVRCIKDYNTPAIKFISPNSSQVGKLIVISGTGFGTERKDSYVSFGTLKVEQSDYKSWNDSTIKLVVPQDAKTGYLFVCVDGIMSNYANFVINTIDPDYYEPITIGTQVWMSRNLNVDYYRNGDTIQQVTKWSELDNMTTGAWCYYSLKVENEELYGKLYNWYAVNDPRGLAPEGWHVASDAEWTKLTDYLGDTTVAGGKMKTTGNLKDLTGLWKAPNFGATNESGFSALPGGKFSEMSFQMLNFYGYWWTSSESDTDNAWYRQITNMSTSCSRLNQNKGLWFSVRCVKD